MPLSRTDIDITIEKVQKALSDYDSCIDLICIHHKTGMRDRALIELRKSYSGNSNFFKVKALLSYWHGKNDTSSQFLGAELDQKNRYGGLYKQKNLICIISLNEDSYSNQKFLEFDLYRMAFDIVKISNELKKSQDLKVSTFIPKLSGNDLLEHNLSADIFASLMLSGIHKKDFATELAKKRVSDLLKENAGYAAYDHAFILTLDQTRHIANKIAQIRRASSYIIERCWQATNVIMDNVDIEKIETWKIFSKNVRNMVLRGFPANLILSAAIDGNENIDSKKLAVQVATLLKIKPSATNIEGGYFNPYKSDSDNEKVHIEQIEEIFETLLTRSIFENSAVPLREKAKEQNIRLQKGQFMGWCASALQETADIFEKSLAANQPPTQTSREVFKVALQKISWEQLKKLGDSVLEAKQNGEDLSGRDFVTFLEKNSNYRIIFKSVVASLHSNQAFNNFMNTADKNEEEEAQELFRDFEIHKKISITTH